MSFEEMLRYKDIVSSQKFSAQWDKFVANVLEKEPTARGAKYDMKDRGKSKHRYENKYATKQDNGSYSFPQLYRDNADPDRYYFFLVGVNQFIICSIAGTDVKNSILVSSATNAHANNKSEKRLTVQDGSPELKYLLSFRDVALEAKFKAATYSI